jgi:hypothetical protein
MLTAYDMFGIYTKRSKTIPRHSEALRNDDPKLLQPSSVDKTGEQPDETAMPCLKWPSKLADKVRQLQTWVKENLVQETA